MASSNVPARRDAGRYQARVRLGRRADGLVSLDPFEADLERANAVGAAGNVERCNRRGRVDGERVSKRRHAVAVGIDHGKRLPGDLPPHLDLSIGDDVAVIVSHGEFIACERHVLPSVCCCWI